MTGRMQHLQSHSQPILTWNALKTEAAVYHKILIYSFFKAFYNLLCNLKYQIHGEK